MSFATKTAGLTGAAMIALLVAMGPAQAAATMCDAKGMMKDDAMMSDDSMAKDDAMMSDDMKGDDMAMADDGMAKDDAMMADDMKSDDMAKDDMAMSDDAMKPDDISGDMMMGSYTVKLGDSLWKIAAATLCDGDRYPEIVAANSDMLGGSMMVHPGDKLMIPGD